MNKIYTAILIIALALFVSCDEQKAKAEDDIKKAFTEITDKAADVVDKATPKPQGSGTPKNAEGEDAGGEGVEEPEDTSPQALIKPALSRESAPWNVIIIFAKIAEHTYELKEEKTGVELTEVTGNRMQITATQSAQNVIIVATLNGESIESNPIEFTRIQGNTLSFANNANGITLKRSGESKYTQAIRVHTTSVRGDNRGVTYSINPTGRGGTIDSASGEVTLTQSAANVKFTVTAELPQTEKYRRATATYTLAVCHHLAGDRPCS